MVHFYQLLLVSVFLFSFVSGHIVLDSGLEISSIKNMLVFPPVISPTQPSFNEIIDSISPLPFFEILKTTYITSFAAAVWVFFCLGTIDFIHSLNKKNGMYFYKYASSKKSNIVYFSIITIITIGIFSTDSMSYDLRGIEIGLASLSFFLPALSYLIKTKKIKIAGKKPNETYINIIFFIVLTFFCISIFTLWKNSNGKYSEFQSIWFQLTIFFGSFYCYMIASIQYYFIKNERFEISNFMKYFLLEIFPTRKVDGHFNVEELEAQFQKINKNLKRDNAIYISKKHKKRKKK